MGETRELAEWISRAAYTDFPPESRECAKGILLKMVASMVVGSREPVGRVLTKYFAERGGAPEAGIIGGGYRTSVDNAAFAHGTFAHAAQMESERFPGVIGDVWMFPAFFALGEKLVSSGEDMLAAAIISWEVAWRTCAATPEMFVLQRLHLDSAVWFGVLGVAAGAARLLNLNPDQTENALSIAASHASGLCAQLGSDAHYIESGHSCRMGLMSAFLAREGATGRSGILERHDGLLGPVWYAGEVSLKHITDGLGKPPYDICNAWIKKFPGAGAAQLPIDILVLMMKENNLKYEDIESVLVEVDDQSRDWGDRPFPDNLGDAMFSIQYILAEVMLRNRVNLNTFQKKENLVAPKYREAMGKVTIIVPPDWSGKEFMSCGCQLTVTRKDGKKFVKHLYDTLGSPRHPLTLEQIRDVSRMYLDDILKKEQSDRVEEIMVNLEKQLDIRELMSVLTFSRIRGGRD